MKKKKEIEKGEVFLLSSHIHSQDYFSNRRYLTGGRGGGKISKEKKRTRWYKKLVEKEKEKTRRHFQWC